MDRDWLEYPNWHMRSVAHHRRRTTLRQFRQNGRTYGRTLFRKHQNSNVIQGHKRTGAVSSLDGYSPCIQAHFVAISANI
jgi:hypothetical protein